DPLGGRTGGGAGALTVGDLVIVGIAGEEDLRLARVGEGDVAQEGARGRLVPEDQGRLPGPATLEEIEGLSPVGRPAVDLYPQLAVVARDLIFDVRGHP